MLTRHRKTSMICACALTNAFVALCIVTSLIGSFNDQSTTTIANEPFETLTGNTLKLRPHRHSMLDVLHSNNSQQTDTRERLDREQSSATGTGNRLTENDDDRNRRTRSEFDYVVEPSSGGRRFCDDDTGQQVSLLIVVCSSIENIDRRNAIRLTWGSQDNLEQLGVRLVFVLALAAPHHTENIDLAAYETDSEKVTVGGIEQYVNEEHRRHGDVLQLNFNDHYVNLTLKTIGALRWAVSRCPSARYVAKADDDVYVNVAALVRLLHDEEYRFRSAFGAASASARSFIAGHVIDTARPVRDRRSKWYTSETMFGDEFYPPYTSGTGYAMGFDVATRLLVEADKADEIRSRRTGSRLSAMRQLFWLEDIYVTGMLAAKLDDVRLVHDDRFNAAHGRDLKARMMSRGMLKMRLPVTDATDIGSKVGYDVDQEELMAEVCWHLRDTITVHDMTPGELKKLWKRLTTATIRTDGVNTEKVDADRLCGVESRQTTDLGGS